MKSEPESEVEERLASVERKLDLFSAEIQRLEKRVSALQGETLETVEPEPEAAFVSGEAEPAILADSLPAAGTVLSVLTEFGRSFLVLGGAFLVRALTDSGMVPRPLGAGLGLAYAALWILLAGRAAGRGRTTSGSFLGITAVVIAFPLIVETTTRMAIFTPSGGAVALAGLTLLCFAVAWRRGLPLLAWAALFASVASASVLSLVTRAVEPFAAAQLAIGIAAAWMAYGDRPVPGVRWPAAAAADLLVLWAAFRLAPSEVPPQGSELSFSSFLFLAFALPFLYLGTFAVRTVARRSEVTLFDAVQSIAALAVGFGGAALVVRYVQDARPTLGASAILVAAGCYGVAFAFLGRRQGSGRNFLFYAALALLLTLSGSALMLRGAPLAVFWCVLALAASVLGARFRRATLALHGAVYALAAAIQSGLARASLDAYLGSARAPWAPFDLAGLGALATALACFLVLTRGEAERARAAWRIPRMALILIAALGAGGLALARLRTLSGADPGTVAALRTAVLAAAALALAAARRQSGLAELGWLAYGVLVIGGMKLLLEDLPAGRPATLFIGFVVFGGALLLVPRVLRNAALRARPD